MTAGRPTGRTLVIQPLPGIGDTIWHLPHLKAIARAAPEGRIALLTKPRSLADGLLAAEPAVDQVLWLHRNKGEHDGLAGFFRLTALIREGGFARVWVLHDSARYAQVAWAAGIPERHGFGLAAQRLFLNRPPFLPRELAKAHPIDKATRLLELKGLDLREADRTLAVAPEALADVNAAYGDVPAPWIALGLGSSETFKQWGAENFAALAAALIQKGASPLLLGGPAERQMAEKVAQAAPGAHNAASLPIDQTAALLSSCRLYVGNDTGVLNMAAAVGTDGIGLFGGSPPLAYSPHIHALTPQDSGAGMAGITVDQVLAAIAAQGL
ncbi:MAG: glycosyltransferase family 9 protein [Pseudomonadota bacterium]